MFCQLEHILKIIFYQCWHYDIGKFKKKKKLTWFDTFGDMQICNTDICNMSWHAKTC